MTTRSTAFPSSKTVRFSSRRGGTRSRCAQAARDSKARSTRIVRRSQIRRYKHDELEGDVVGTAFTNDTAEVEVMGSHRALGRMKGSVGGWVLNRAFDASGEEALSPAVDQQGFATFLYEEVTWPHMTFQFGGRVDHTSYQPNGEPERTFTTGSGSLGLLIRPAAADDRLTIALSAARAARSPALEELFYFGAHPGNFAFEVGNPDLDPSTRSASTCRCAGARRA